MEADGREKKPVRVTVGGMSFTVLAPGDPAETVRLAAQVDEMMTRVAAHSGHADSTRAAILTCLHLADRVHALETELDGLRQRIESKTRRVAAILDQAIASDL